MKLPADHRVHAVGTDEEVAFDGGTGGQMQRDAVSIHREARGFATGSHRLHSDGLEQRAVQRRPHRHHERTAEDTARYRGSFQSLTARPPSFCTCRFKGSRQHVAGDAQIGQCRHGIRRKADAETQLPQRSRPFENPDVPPRTTQGDAGGEPPNTGAYD
jgi:hypothetical protein